MKSLMSCLLVVGFLVFTLDIDGGNAWWLGRRRTKSSSCTGRNGTPYYFGTTSLLCMASKGKRAPSRGTLALKHRFIYFGGYYFERLKKEDVYGRSARDSDKCKSSREGSPAGYTRLSVDCIKRCTRRYRQRYGRYRLFSNNCHHFANRISKILCDYTSCPGWCR